MLGINTQTGQPLAGIDLSPAEFERRFGSSVRVSGETGETHGHSLVSTAPFYWRPRDCCGAALCDQ